MGRAVLVDAEAIPRSVFDLDASQFRQPPTPLRAGLVKLHGAAFVRPPESPHMTRHVTSGRTTPGSRKVPGERQLAEDEEPRGLVALRAGALIARQLSKCSLDALEPCGVGRCRAERKHVVTRRRHTAGPSLRARPLPRARVLLLRNRG